MKVRLANSKDSAAWNKFITNYHPEHHAHLWSWKRVFENSFGHKCYYLIAENESNTICGILPLVLINSLLFGRSLISLPYLNGGGLLAEAETVGLNLIEHALKISREESCRYTEIRERKSSSFLKNENFISRSHKVSMKLELKETYEKTFASFPSKLRSQIRRPEREQMTVTVFTPNASSTKIETDSAAQSFYSVFAKNMRDLGTPVYPFRLFAETLNENLGNSTVITVFLKNTAVASGLLVGFGDSIEMVWASSLKEHNSKSPNMLLYSRAIEHACKSGYKYFDFGRSTPDSSTYHFKAQWGAKASQLFWYYPNTCNAPDINPSNSKFKFLVFIWKRLPLFLANWLGPILTKGIP